MCSDVYEYQQVQAVEDSTANPEPNSDMEDAVADVIEDEIMTAHVCHP